MTHLVVYRRTPIYVEVLPNGIIRRAYVGPEIDITGLLSDEQKEEISEMVREEMEDD